MNPARWMSMWVVSGSVVMMGCSGPVAPGHEEPAPAEHPAESSGDPVTRRTEPSAEPRAARPSDFATRTAIAAVEHLAGVIGPRHATSAAYTRAASWVAEQLADLGYTVRRQAVAVPGGVSWGVPVAAGRSTNVIAAPPGFDSERPHLVVGAHLDTVPQAPGAEDNASGVGVVLAVAQAVAERRTRLPVLLVAFGAEEPRGPSDHDHHYGSRRYVASLTPQERAAVRAMVSLDRVGVGARVPVGSVTQSDPVQRALLAAARRAGVPTVMDPGQRSSDHWSFVRAGLPGARLGSTPYAGYHSSGDVPPVVSADQIERVGRLLLEWLSPRQRRLSGRGPHTSAAPSAQP